MQPLIDSQSFNRVSIPGDFTVLALDVISCLKDLQGNGLLNQIYELNLVACANPGSSL
ncbi:hypothetical protein P0S91_21400 [Gloeocapsopsis dulcis]|uniref:hypothetical protein n=1 Tax=Gloeocapsopsis dulcis TaxID=2859516 RepID=UPI0012DAB157|nr:hypothetical protein [Gloeocapsopsis dulcis]WNN88797.1 hypothetical protein P0S91_21400 [Gloeocapsopsis dulcis]